MCRHVLIPVDGSDSSWDAFEHALEEHPEDALTVLHVIDPREGDYEPGAAGGEPVQRSERVEQGVRERLRETGIDDDQIDYVT